MSANHIFNIIRNYNLLFLSKTFFFCINSVLPLRGCIFSCTDKVDKFPHSV